jgi:hypothetical protein
MGADGGQRPERLLDVEVKSFVWTKDAQPDIGFIAEDVAETVPELFHTDAQFTGVKSGHLPFYLLELIKQQQAQINDLKVELAKLTGTLKREDEPWPPPPPTHAT